MMAVAATLGAANSLYAIVDSRRRELATLCALGFTPGPLVTAIVTESTLLALCGAFIGVGLAWFFFNGFAASPLGSAFSLLSRHRLRGSESHGHSPWVSLEACCRR
jgi:putative ABC transport system permease protein